MIAAAWAALVVRRRRARTGTTSPGPIGAEFKTQTVTVGRWTWRVHRGGRGPTLLLLHGLGADLYCWRSLAALLKDQYSLIIPDLPGFGGSSKHDDVNYGLDDQIPRLVELLDHLKVGRIAVVGNSMGGNIALWFALRQPGRVRAVVAIAPAVSPRLIPPGLNYFSWVAQPLSYLATTSAIGWIHGRTVSRANVIDAERIRQTLTTYGRQQAAIRTLLRATEAIRDARLPLGLARIEAPVMILWGSRDRLVSRAVIDGLEQALPHAQSYVHLGGGHHLQEDEPEWTAEKLTSFFRQLPD